MEGKEGIDALFQFATEGILVVNSKGEITRINPSAEKIFGYLKGELVGKKIEVLVPAKYAAGHHEHRQKYDQHPHPRSMGKGMELYGLKKNGQEIPVEISLSPYETANGKFTIAFIVDITQRKQAAEKLKNYSAELEKQVKNRTLILEEAIAELEKTKKDLKDALAKEKDLNEMKSRFVSMASHEFRTPLATILSSLSLVKKYGEQNDADKQNRHINKIKTSITALTEILNDFLSVSKLEDGRIENTPETFDLAVFVHEILQEIRPIARSGQVIRMIHSGSDNVTLDRKHLRNIIYNLVSNAIKFSNEGQEILISTEVKKGLIKLSVKDQGIGIPKADQAHLFERFFRGHNATNIQGTGLGLNIVLKYLELMNGKIKFESEENKGTEFIITFPQ